MQRLAYIPPLMPPRGVVAPNAGCPNVVPPLIPPRAPAPNAGALVGAAELLNVVEPTLVDVLPADPNPGMLPPVPNIPEPINRYEKVFKLSKICLVPGAVVEETGEEEVMLLPKRP